MRHPNTTGGHACSYWERKPQIRTENGNQLSRVYKDMIQPELNTHTHGSAQMLSFTVCWVIPREWRGWKTSRFRPLAEETTHIYIFFKLFTSPIQQHGGQAARFMVPIPVPAAPTRQCPAPHSGATSTHNLCQLQQQGLVPTASQSLCSHKSPSGASTGLLWPLPSSPPLIPCPGARGQAPGQTGTSRATRNGTSVPIKTHHYVKIHIEIWIDRLDKNGSWFLLV